MLWFDVGDLASLKEEELLAQVFSVVRSVRSGVQAHASDLTSPSPGHTLCFFIVFSQCGAIFTIASPTPLLDARRRLIHNRSFGVVW